MKINDDTIRQLRQVQAQANLPVYPAPLETDTGTQHYTDAESEEVLTQTDSEEFVRRLALNRSVRNAPRMNVQSEPERKGNLIGNAIIFSVCVFAVGFVLMLIAACWH